MISCLRSVRRLWVSLRYFARSENGAAYSVGLTLLTPLYALMICFLIELTLMLHVQVGVEYAAYSAARAAIVWLPAEETALSGRGDLEAMVHRAAGQALAPYASGRDRHQRGGGVPSGSDDYLRVYQALAGDGGSLSPDYVRAKWNYAMQSTFVQWEVSDPGPGSGVDAPVVTVTVRYEMPFHTPGVGRILGRKTADGRIVRDLEASVSLQLEQPRTEDGSLGFDYDSRPAGG